MRRNGAKMVTKLLPYQLSGTGRNGDGVGVGIGVQHSGTPRTPKQRDWLGGSVRFCSAFAKPRESAVTAGCTVLVIALVLVGSKGASTAAAALNRADCCLADGAGLASPGRSAAAGRPRAPAAACACAA